MSGGRQCVCVYVYANVSVKESVYIIICIYHK